MAEPIHDRVVVVAGHICLDLIPRFESTDGTAALRPGELVNVGEAILATGGPVSNTGLALHRLGVPTRLVAKVGDDAFGHEVQRLLRGHAPDLADGIRVDAKAATSYTVVISPPGVDRLFLHHPGANQTFGPEDASDAVMAGASMLHFGYPPLMRRFFAEGPGPMVELYERAHAQGLATSLDACGIDPTSEAGGADWRVWLTQVMPHTDLFSPSLDELRVMLGHGPVEPAVDIDLVTAAADELLGMGVAIVAIKLGEHGLLLRAADNPQRLQRLAHLIDMDRWAGACLYVPCFDVEVAGTTGAGDSTIAGLLTAVTLGQTPDEAIRAAVAVGACSVETVEAVTGIRPWAQVAARLAEGWPRRSTPALADWHCGHHGVWRPKHGRSE